MKEKPPVTIFVTTTTQHYKDRILAALLEAGYEDDDNDGLVEQWTVAVAHGDIAVNIFHPNKAEFLDEILGIITEATALKLEAVANLAPWYRIINTEKQK